MVLLLLSSFIYFIILLILSLIFSINLYNNVSSSTSDNFECGFYTIVTSSMRYRFNYWMIIFHFLIFELELLMSLFLIFGFVTINSNNMVCILLSLLFIELLIKRYYFIKFIFYLLLYHYLFNIFIIWSVLIDYYILLIIFLLF